MTKPSLEHDDWCFDRRTDWLELNTLLFKSDGSEIGISDRADYFSRSPKRIYTQEDADKYLVPRPYSPAFDRMYPKSVLASRVVFDLASSLLRGGRQEVRQLIANLLDIPKLRSLKYDFIELCLKGAVATGSLVAAPSGRGKNKSISISLGSDQVEREKARLYAGSIAGELKSLSDRIGMLIGHGPTVGTYRENLLQTLLRKHLPARYHVATGFIYQCPRQIDILIYDQADYAPIFREDDLVVVPWESVRAVIEVKTNLTSDSLNDSLTLLEDVSVYDNGQPPYFKGIFAFDSALKAETLAETVLDFYADPWEADNPLMEAHDGEWTDDFLLPDDEPADDEDNQPQHKSKPLVDFDEYQIGAAQDSKGEESSDEIDDMHAISQPFWHLTSLCVLEHSYLYVDYDRDEAAERWMPTLYSYNSATDLKLQVTLFLDTLLGYLRVDDALKPARIQEMTRTLGADVHRTQIGTLTKGAWGAYFNKSFDLPDADELVENLERTVVDATRWLRGEYRFK